MALKNSIIRKIAYYQTLISVFTFSDENVVKPMETTEKPKDFERNPQNDDDDDQRQGRVAEFNNELTMALLRATQGKSHYCAQLVELQNSNKTVEKRQKRFVWFFGIAIGLVICK